MEQDHIVSEVRKNQEKLSEQFNNDLDKLFEHFKKEENIYKSKLKNFQPKKKSGSF